MPQVKLSSIVEALDIQNDETLAYLDRQTGQVLVVSDEDLRAAEDGDDLTDYPEWQRASIEQAKAVQADDIGRFVPLPDRFEIDEWGMMSAFALSLDDPATSERLLNAIHGRGAFRYFKDRVHEADLADRWYKFRDDQHHRVALKWCEANGIEPDPSE